MTPIAAITPIGWCLLVGVFAAAVSIYWAGLRAGIAPMPSSRRACRAMIDAAAGAPAGSVVDFGSGWGTLAIGFAQAYPERSVVGYELSFVPWLVSTLVARGLRLRNVEFRRQDFRAVDLGEASVLLCYLFRGGMAELSGRLAAAAERPSCVISNTFALPAHQASRVIRLADLHRTTIYLYRFDGA